MASDTPAIRPWRTAMVAGMVRGRIMRPDRCKVERRPGAHKEPAGTEATVTTEEATDLVRGAVLGADGAPIGPVWADLGSGSGTFTFALAAILGPTGRVIAVDRERAAIEALRRGLSRQSGSGPRAVAEVSPVVADFRDLDGLPALDDLTLDGALFANALHFDPDPRATLSATARRLRQGGRLVVVEYQDRPPNPWVPHPLPVARLEQVAAAAGLGAPRIVGERPSSYGGVLYCAWLPVD